VATKVALQRTTLLRVTAFFLKKEPKNFRPLGPLSELG
jgi:hypothetical protein